MLLVMESRLIESLKLYDPNLSFSELTRLSFRGQPRDTSMFYKHSNKHLFLRMRRIQNANKIIEEWTDITNDYDWDKLLSNPDNRMCDCKTPSFSQKLNDIFCFL